MSRRAWLVGLVMLSSCGQRPLQPRDPDPGVPHFTVATFNVFDEHASDPATIEAIGATGADVIALQETTPESEAILRARYAEKYPHSLFKLGIGFLSIYPMVERDYLPSLDGWHSGLHVTVTTPAGPIELLNVHLAAPEGKFLKSLKSIADMPAVHRDQMQEFVDTCARKPVVVLGDFNEDDGGAAVSWLEGRGFHNILPLYHPGQFTWQGKSVGGQFAQALDHIMFSSSLQPLDSWVGGNGVSDHIPVMAHLEASGTCY
ncbi:MAG: endonuclease/exonuclease/phosphatase family protein [Polyangiales bacterium]